MWITKIEALKAGDACEFRFPARAEWQAGTVVRNGGASWWAVKDANGEQHDGLYIEYVRCPGQTEAWAR